MISDVTFKGLNPYQALANAIIIQAVEDYRVLMGGGTGYLKRQKKEIERFFLSKWFGVLTTADPELIIEKLHDEEAKILEERDRAGCETKPGEGCLTVGAASQMGHIDATNIYKAISKGKLPAEKVGGIFQIRISDFEEWLCLGEVNKTPKGGDTKGRGPRQISEGYMGMPEAAEFIGKSKSQIYRLIQNRKIPAVYQGGCWQVKVEDAEKFLNQNAKFLGEKNVKDAAEAMGIQPADLYYKIKTGKVKARKLNGKLVVPASEIEKKS